MASSAGDLAGHVAIVTGANHGIGDATARLLAERGAAVFVTYLRAPLVDTAANPEVYALQRATDGSTVVDAIRAGGGRASRLRGEPCRPRRHLSGGALGFPEEVSYGAAKPAQENYTMSAAAELARHGVTAMRAT